MIRPKTVKLPRKLKKELKRVERVLLQSQSNFSTSISIRLGYKYVFKKPNKWSHKLKLILIREERKMFRKLQNDQLMDSIWEK